MKKIKDRIESYVLGTEEYSIPRIIGEFLLLDIIVTLLLQIIVFLFITFFIALPLLVINPHLDINHALSFLQFNQEIITEAVSKKPNALYASVFAVIIAPCIETFLFQALPVWLLSFITKSRKILVVSSAFFFALAHVYPLLMLYILPGGVILAWAFVMLRNRNGGVKAFFVTASIHGLFNFINLMGAMVLGY